MLFVSAWLVLGAIQAVSEALNIMSPDGPYSRIPAEEFSLDDYSSSEKKTTKKDLSRANRAPPKRAVAVQASTDLLESCLNHIFQQGLDNGRNRKSNKNKSKELQREQFGDLCEKYLDRIYVEDEPSKEAKVENKFAKNLVKQGQELDEQIHRMVKGLKIFTIDGSSDTLENVGVGSEPVHGGYAYDVFKGVGEQGRLNGNVGRFPGKQYFDLNRSQGSLDMEAGKESLKRVERGHIMRPSRGRGSHYLMESGSFLPPRSLSVRVLYLQPLGDVPKLDQSYISSTGDRLQRTQYLKKMAASLPRAPGAQGRSRFPLEGARRGWMLSDQGHKQILRQYISSRKPWVNL